MFELSTNSEGLFVMSLSKEMQSSLIGLSLSLRSSV